MIFLYKTLTGTHFAKYFLEGQFLFSAGIKPTAEI